MRPIITIKVEIEPIGTVLRAFEEAVRLASNLNVYIQFDFNGIMCSAGPYDDQKKGEESYKIAVKNNINFAFSF